LNAKPIFERLARTPRLSPRKVAELQASGLSVNQIEARFGSPRGQAPRDPYCTPACAEYPRKLLDLADPPLRLFHKGLPLEQLPALVVGVVGSRGASRFGQQWARKLGSSLARRGVSVCSGLAQGIDGAVHRGVVDELHRNSDAAPPIGVLGHGWGPIFPLENTRLAQEVERYGLLLTEYQRGSPPARWTFPARNRIIASLSDHLVVVEAGARSGSLYTAEFALDLGRTVWIVPNAPGRPNSAGVLALWRGGADAILDLEEFAETIAPSTQRLSAPNNPLSKLSKENTKLLELLYQAEGTVDDICRNLSWSPTELAYRLTELEIDGLIRRRLDGAWDVLCWDLLGHLDE
jgi:DNA processing protein